ncbi:hypothetical protein AAFF_G00412570 [Aldrovandia affinis]|uniref:Uncharacterized protein n=1 Tax=Aldrovandia affinis TaxID=143900 RepID=A0AAD7SB04_9TELE|nr:hypothetical protein AAFF_G00412570 [Aldrovandia affinis]
MPVSTTTPSLRPRLHYRSSPWTPTSPTCEKRRSQESPLVRVWFRFTGRCRPCKVNSSRGRGGGRGEALIEGSGLRGRRSAEPELSLWGSFPRLTFSA